MRAPPRDPPHGEDRRAEVRRNAERVVDDGREEIHVHRERRACAHRVVHALGHVEELLPTGGLRHGFRHPAQHPGTGIVDLVDAVAEAGHPRPRVAARVPRERRPRPEAPLHERLGARGVADLAQHREHVLVGAAVAGPLQGRDRRHDGGVEVGEGRDRHAPGERRGVELVVGVERQNHVEHPRHFGRGRPAAEQLEEVRGVRVHPRGLDRRLPRADPLPRGDRLRHQGHQPDRLAQIRLPIARACVGIVGGGERHRRPQRVERVGVARQALEECLDRRGQAARRPQARGERHRLGRRRQLAKPEQRRHVLEAHRPRQVADLVAAVVEPPGLAVHPADRRARRDHVLEPRLPRRLHAALPEGLCRDRL